MFIVFDISTYWSITDSFSLDSPTRHAIPMILCTIRSMASQACHTDHPASTLVIWCMEKHEKQRLWGCLICLGFLGQWRMWRYINYINNVNLCKVHKVHKIYRFYQRYRKYVKVYKIYKIIRYIRLYKIYKKYKLYIKYINPEYW